MQSNLTKLVLGAGLGDPVGAEGFTAGTQLLEPTGPVYTWDHPSLKL